MCVRLCVCVVCVILKRTSRTQLKLGKKGTCIKHLFAHTKNYYLVKRRERKKQRTNILWQTESEEREKEREVDNDDNKNDDNSYSHINRNSSISFVRRAIFSLFFSLALSPSLSLTFMLLLLKIVQHGNVFTGSTSRTTTSSSRNNSSSILCILYSLLDFLFCMIEINAVSAAY